MKLINPISATFLFLLATVLISYVKSQSILEDITTHLPDLSTTTELNIDLWQKNNLWVIIVGFILAFVLAFGVGANDVANVFGTSVGSKVLTLRQACCIATIAECAGAILIGYKVSDTVRKGILDVPLYAGSEKELMLGFLAALGGSSVWNLVATALSLPISGTHTIVGATVGFSICARGFSGVNWYTFGKIVASWFVSPLLSGAISASIFILVRYFILNKDDPIGPGLRSLPFFYGFTVLVNVFSVVHDGPQMLYFHYIPWWGAVIASVGVAAIVSLLVLLVLVPHQKKHIKEIIASRNKSASFTFGSSDTSGSNTPPRELATIENGVMTPTTYCFSDSQTPSNGYTSAKEATPNLLAAHNRLTIVPSADTTLNLPENASQLPLCGDPKSEGTKKEEEEEAPEVGQMFSFLQIMTATFGSFAHGGNDVSNAIGPLIGLWAIYTEGGVEQKSEPPIYLLLFGGIGISVGLWVWGRKVIKTVGEDLTKVTPSSGFTIEIGSAFTVLLASKCGLPISTTHCKVGSVVFVGWAKSSKDGVDWSLFRNIVIAWIVTVPLTAAISALIMVVLRASFL